MIAVTIGIIMKMDGTTALIATSIATDRIRERAAVRVDDGNVRVRQAMKLWPASPPAC
jgi:hypothetical protein